MSAVISLQQYADGTSSSDNELLLESSTDAPLRLSRLGSKSLVVKSSTSALSVVCGLPFSGVAMLPSLDIDS